MQRLRCGQVWNVLTAGLVAIACLAAPTAVAAEDDDEGDSGSVDDVTADQGGGFQRVEAREPREGTPLIANKLYPMQYRLEFSGFFDVSYADKYVDHIGGHAGVGFHLFDWLAVEGYGGYLAGDETGIVGNVRSPVLGGASARRLGQGLPCANAGCEPQLPDMWQTTWFVGADVQWAPIYGKISAVSEYDLNFQFYTRGGVGVEGIQRALNDGTVSEAQIRPSLNYGLGVRLIPWKYIAIRAELVNSHGINPNVEEHDSTDEGACTDGYVLTSGNEDNCLVDISGSAMFQLGVSFLL